MPQSSARTRGTQGKKALGALAGASERLQALESAGLTPSRLGALLRKSVEAMEALVSDVNADPFARAAAAKFLARDIVGVAPSRSATPAAAPQVPITIVLPDYGRKREPKQVQATVIESEPQPRAIAGVLPNVG